MSPRKQKQASRLRRQIDALARGAPVPRAPIEALLDSRMRLVRAPLAVLLILGSFLSILPVFGVWMLPAGLLLLAIDVPRLRPHVSGAMIRARRWWALRRRRGRSPQAAEEGPPVSPSAKSAT